MSFTGDGSVGRSRHAEFVAGAILLALACVLVTACLGGPVARDLGTEPEANLYFPDSTVLGSDAAEPELTIEGRTNRYVGHLVGANASAKAISDFYDTALRELGWDTPTDNVAGAFGIRTTAELDAFSWRKGDLVFRLGIRDKEDPLGPPGELAARYETIYRIDLIESPPGQPRPS